VANRKNEQPLDRECSVKILVVHHARSVDLPNVYLSDDFVEANECLFGAQELDTWGGVRLLSLDNLVWRLEICPNQSVVRLIAPEGGVLAVVPVEFPDGWTKLCDRFYFLTLVKYLDTSIAYFARTSLKSAIEKCLLGLELDLIWYDTQFYDALIGTHVPVIVRSVNYEPKHVIAEDSSLFRWIRSLGKTLSEFKIARNRSLVGISPSDVKNYRNLGARKISQIPLRQLPFLMNTNFPLVEGRSKLIFFGSTFDVRHNRRNLEFIVHDIAPIIEREIPDIQIQSFGHRIPTHIDLPANMKHFGFIENLQGRQMGALGVIVPWHGGAGMQSKIFEPLCLGVPIIANPKNFAGYDFLPGTHYLPATSPREYVEAVKYLLSHPNEARDIGENARLLAEKTFNFQAYAIGLNRVLGQVSDS